MVGTARQPDWWWVGGGHVSAGVGGCVPIHCCGHASAAHGTTTNRRRRQPTSRRFGGTKRLPENLHAYASAKIRPVLVSVVTLYSAGAHSLHFRRARKKIEMPNWMPIIRLYSAEVLVYSAPFKFIEVPFLPSL